jgi:methionyl-tRNA formyltransferase
MILVGEGGTISKALKLSLDLGHPVDFGITNYSDPSVSIFKRFGVKVIESTDFNNSLRELMKKKEMKVNRQSVILINNKTIINNEILESNADFYNFHFGLTQKYRGIGEICVISAIQKDEQEYGVTLHKVLPRQKVDKGPILRQQSFPMSNESTFATVMDSCLRSMFDLYVEMVSNILSRSYTSTENTWESNALSFKDLDSILQNSRPDQVKRILAFGSYQVFLSDFYSLLETKVANNNLF